MDKKPYTPRVIDLSLEAVTGIGASACNTGLNQASASCTALGLGAGATGCNLGDAAGGSCPNGNLPSYGGTCCFSGGLETKGCGTGGTTSYCFAGTTPGYTNTNCSTGGSGSCQAGSADAHFCDFGDSQAAVS
ncbi:MAG: hypothetical protein HQK56_05830 [Deltaproteobacteria bacterium]|nr:hypothetical protein [Deltaproteobacteria bacterium]